MKKIALIVIGFSSLLLTACSTVEGVGKDLKTLGNQIEKSTK